MKSATQPRNRFTALASKQKMSWVKRCAGCYLRNSSRRWDDHLLIDTLHFDTMHVKWNWMCVSRNEPISCMMSKIVHRQHSIRLNWLIHHTITHLSIEIKNGSLETKKIAYVQVNCLKKWKMDQVRFYSDISLLRTSK